MLIIALQLNDRIVLHPPACSKSFFSHNAFVAIKRKTFECKRIYFLVVALFLEKSILLVPGKKIPILIYDYSACPINPTPNNLYNLGKIF